MALLQRSHPQQSPSVGTDGDVDIYTLLGQRILLWPQIAAPEELFPITIVTYLPTYLYISLSASLSIYCLVKGTLFSRVKGTWCGRGLYMVKVTAEN